MSFPPKVLKPRHLKGYRIKLTRGQRKEIRAGMGLLGVSGKGARRKIAGLRRTDSGIETHRPKAPFELVPEKSKRPLSEKTKTAEQYQRMKHQKKAKKGGGKRGTRGNRPRREAKKQKKKQ